MNPTLNGGVVCRRVRLNRTDDLLALEESCFSTDRISRRNLRHLLRSPSAYCIGAYRGGELLGSMVVLFRRNARVARGLGIADGFKPGKILDVQADGKTFQVKARVDTPLEIEYLRNGGVLNYVLRNFMAEA